MNLKTLALILMYYSFISVLFLGISPLNNPEIATSNVNLTNITQEQTEPESGSAWSVFASIYDNIIKFFAFVSFGLVIGGSAPSWFALSFSLWQTSFTIFSIAFFIDAIWGG